MTLLRATSKPIREPGWFCLRCGIDRPAPAKRTRPKPGLCADCISVDRNWYKRNGMVSPRAKKAS